MTLADVAAVAHVSLATVSQVLNGRPSCWASVETRKRVLDAVAELGYRPNLSARALRSGETRTIGMITTGLGIGSAHNRFSGVEAAAEKEGYTVMLSFHPNTSETEDLRIRNLLDRGVDGLLVYPAEPGLHTELRKLAASKFPLVTFDGAALLDFETDDLCPDYHAVGRLQVRHLLDLGRRRLCMLTTKPIARINVLREEGILAALAEAGLPPPLTLTVDQSSTEEQPDLGAAESLIRDFLNANRGRIDGLISFDTLATVAMRALLTLGIRVPEDIAVMGGGDTIVGAYNTLPLSTVSTRDDVQGEEAFRLLLDRMKGRLGGPVPRRLLKEPVLMARASTTGQR